MIMREILFRGIVLENNKWNGKWIYGDLIHNVDCKKIREQEIEINHIAKSFIIDENTLGQFTGLLDKNGNKIFDGDIVKTKYIDELGYVIYNDENTSFEICFKNHSETLGLLNYSYELEIVGNIHDNKEFYNGL